MSDEIVAVTKDNFQQTVVDAKKPVLVDFWAAWCGPCRAVAPILEELATEYKGKIVIAKVNVDENPQLASSYSVASIPTLIAFKGGKPAKQLLGLRKKAELKEMLDGLL
ncbi:MAG: thioredoxin [Chloroflexota bacterium]